MLTFNLKKEWFEKIKSGEKTHEYRIQSLYWQKKLKIDIRKNDIETNFYFYDKTIICFKCGYPKNNEKDKILYAKLKSISTNIYGPETDLEINEPVFDIEFELVK